MTPISTALLAERTRRGWNQRAAARWFKTTQPTYSKWELGAEPGGEYLPAIWAFLGLDEQGAAELVFRDRMHRAGVTLDQARRMRADFDSRDD